VIERIIWGYQNKKFESETKYGRVEPRKCYFVLISKNGTKKILLMLHMEKCLFWVFRQKPGYLEHTNSDFEFEKCVMKMRPRDT
jgi:hypothetical protein